MSNDTKLEVLVANKLDDGFQIQKDLKVHKKIEWIINYGILFIQ